MSFYYDDTRNPYKKLRNNRQIQVDDDDAIVALGIHSLFSLGKKIVVMGRLIEEGYVSDEVAKGDLTHYVFLHNDIRPDLNALYVDETQKSVAKAVAEQVARMEWPSTFTARGWSNVAVNFSWTHGILNMYSDLNKPEIQYIKTVSITFVGNSLDHHPLDTALVVLSALGINIKDVDPQSIALPNV